MSVDTESEPAPGEQTGEAPPPESTASVSAGGGDTAGGTSPRTPADEILDSPEQLDRLLQMMLTDDKDLAASLNKAGLTPDKLIEEVQRDRAGIRQSVTPECDAVSRARVLAESASQLMVAPSELPVGGNVTAVIGFLGMAGGAALGCSYISHLTSRESLLLQVAAGVGFGFGLLLALLRVFTERINEESAEHARQRNQRLGIVAANSRLEAAGKALDTALIARGLRPTALTCLEAKVNPGYSTALTYISAAGLSEVYNAEKFEVGTPSFDRVKHALDHSSGGSIGLAGPRGTGKSTVIASFVAERTRIGGGSGLAVEVSAPVDYNPREFLLHLFAEACRKVFASEPKPGYYETEMASRVSRSASRNRTLLTALLGTCLAAVGALLVLIGSRELTFHPQLWAGFALLGLGAVASCWAVISPSRARPEERQTLRELEAGIPAPSYSDRTELVDLARHDLAMIRYQETYTSGWSGSVTATAGPLAAQAGATGQASYQQNVLSVPDIVEEFQEYIKKAAEAGPVVIGIDELDKIQNPDRAQAFLNDIKSIFGMAGCYFLISISEEALASFERRGLPIRDAFDSALDDVVRIPPLDYQTGRKLIRGRVVGLSEPYVALAYCLSGGLPRDMIRWARSIVMAGQAIGAKREKSGHGEGAGEPSGEGPARDGKAEEKPHLSEVTAVVVGEDLQRKVQASLTALSELSDPDAPDSMRFLGGLKVAAVSSWLLARCEDCLGSPPPAAPTLPGWLAGFMPALRGGGADQGGAGTKGAGSPRSRLMFELAGYFYFCATVLEIFTDDLTEAAYGRLSAADGPATFGQLARARQLFGTDTLLAVAQIDIFREACGPPCAGKRGPQPDMLAQFTGPRPTSTIQT